MTALLTELKTRARLRLNAGRADEPGLRLRHCLNAVARDVGFGHWEHARHVLGGQAQPGEDLGSFWHAPRCNSLLNPWFADLAQARAALAAGQGRVLLPYRRQFVVVRDDYLLELALDPRDPAWAEAGGDLVAAYGRAPWLRLARQRLNAPRTSFRA